MEIVKWLLYLFIGVGLAQRLCWWFGRIYFPFGWSACKWVYNNKSRWWRKAGEFLTHKPEGATVVGFICTLLWPLLIGLNTLILAQILELFISGGRRIPIPWVGTYSFLSLVSAILWAIIQTICGIIFDAVKAKTFWPKLGKVALLVVISASVVGEAALAVYRAWLLTAGQIPILPTQVDMIIFQYGPWVAGIIGFFVPIGEILAGTFGFLQFINMIVKSSLYWFSGIMTGVWGIGIWWVCGFYDDEPKRPTPPTSKIKLPLSIVNLDNETKELENDVSKLKKDTETLQEQLNSSRSLLNTIQSFEKQKERVEVLKKKIEDKRWEDKIKNMHQKITQAKDKDSLNQIKREIQKANREIKDIQDEIIPLEREIAGFSKLNDWKKEISKFRGKFEDEIKKTNNKWELLNLSPRHETLKKCAEDIMKILQGQTIDSLYILPDQVEEIQIYQRKANINNPNSKLEIEEREKAKEILSKSQQIVNGVIDRRLPEIGGELKNIGETLNRLKGDFNNHTVSTTTTYSEVETEILKIDTDIKSYRKEFKGLQWKCKIRYLSLLLLPWNWRKGGNQQ